MPRKPGNQSVSITITAVQRDRSSIWTERAAWYMLSYYAREHESFLKAAQALIRDGQVPGGRRLDSVTETALAVNQKNCCDKTRCPALTRRHDFPRAISLS